MKQYIYNKESAAPYDTVEATFEFTDVDGNRVKGSHSRSTILNLLETRGDVMIKEFHPTKNKPESWMNGIIDTSKRCV